MRLHVFFIKTPLEYFAAESIVRLLPAEDVKGLVIYEENLRGIVDDEKWHFKEEHLLRKHKKKERIRYLAKYNHSLLNRCAEYISDSGKVTLSIPRLKNNHSNYFIHMALKSFGKSNVNISIIPHGLADVGSVNIGFKSYVKMLFKSINPIRRYIYGLRYFVFNGDAQGRDHPLVDNVYFLPGIKPSRFSGKKYKEVSIESPVEVGGSEKALILGQPLFRHKIISPDQEKKISNAIYQHLKSVDMHHHVDYLPHPRCEDDKEFYRSCYNLIENRDGMEALLYKSSYKTIISYCSSGLFTARMMLGKSADIVSIGFNLSSYPQEVQLTTRQAFKQYAVIEIDCVE